MILNFCTMHSTPHKYLRSDNHFIYWIFLLLQKLILREKWPQWITCSRFRYIELPARRRGAFFFHLDLSRDICRERRSSLRVIPSLHRCRSSPKDSWSQRPTRLAFGMLTPLRQSFFTRLNSSNSARCMRVAANAFILWVNGSSGMICLIIQSCYVIYRLIRKTLLGNILRNTRRFVVCRNGRFAVCRLCFKNSNWHAGVIYFSFMLGDPVSARDCRIFVLLCILFGWNWTGWCWLTWPPQLVNSTFTQAFLTFCVSTVCWNHSWFNVRYWILRHNGGDWRIVLSRLVLASFNWTLFVIYVRLWRHVLRRLDGITSSRSCREEGGHGDVSIVLAWGYLIRSTGCLYTWEYRSWGKWVIINICFFLKKSSHT